MTRLILVRHGRAAAAWDADHDPGLDDVGRAEAEAMADALAPAGPLPIVVSPLRRARETAAALERRWDVEARVEPCVGEIPSPTDDLAARGDWLRQVLVRRWSELEPSLHRWQVSVLGALLGLGTDTVVVTHFVAINAAVGWATGDDRVVCFSPANCSRTVLEHDGETLRVVELGAQSATLVQ